MAENFDERYERSLYLIDRLEAILHEFIEDGKQLSKDTARSMEQTNKRLENLGIARDQDEKSRLELRAAMESLAKTVERTSRTVENLCTAQGQAAEDRLDLRADMQSLARSMEQTNKRLENLGIARDQDEESRLELRAAMESLARSMEQTNKRLENLGIARDQDEESSLRVKVRMDSLERTVERTNRTMEKLGIIQGQVAEDLFYRNLPVLLKDYHITRKDLLRNIIGEGKREYDLVAVNSSHIFVFEVKNKLRSDDIERFHDVQLPDFKLNFPDYANHTVYGGIGALVVRDDLQRRAEKLGLFVLTQGENESAHLHTPRKLLEF